jgi:uncharacterized membrane-anchored protein YhcB (DUF1043 family)
VVIVMPLLVLVVGVLVGALAAYRVFHAGTLSSSRRALRELQSTLDGLESAYSMKVATFEAQRDLAMLSGLRPEHVRGRIHLPRPDLDS